ncbi:MAG: hypothetical protein ACFFBJ_06290 [Promethearchaeota archaeon]|jgi:hypothetical protein
MLSDITRIPSRDLFTLWWTQRWVRFLVIALLPVSIIDSYYTIQLVRIFGAEAEVNPVGSYMLGIGQWWLWTLFNTIGFALFCMLSGSYYLSVRKYQDIPNTFLFSLILSLRVGMAAYNVTFYYLESIAAGYPPLWISILATGISFILLNRLFTLKHDLSWKRFKAQIQSRIDGLRDRRLIGTTKKSSEESTPVYSGVTTESEPPEGIPRLSRRKVLAKRLGYLGLWVVTIAVVFLIMEVILNLSGLWEWYDRPQGWVSLDSWFLVFFLQIIIFVGVSVYFLYKAFDVHEYKI